MFNASESLEDVPLLLRREKVAFAAAGYETLFDLLNHLPKRHEDRRRFDCFPDQPSGESVCLRGTVVDTRVRRFGAGRRVDEAVLMDNRGGVFGSSTITCRWFNMSFLHKMVAAGQEAVAYGKVKELGGARIMDHPEFEVLCENGPESIHVERIVPIYRNISGVSQRRLREIIHLLLIQVDHSTLQPDAWTGERTLADLLVNLHFPATLDLAREARRGLAFEEFFKIQLRVLWLRARHQEQNGRVLGTRTTLLKRFHEALPFKLTECQKRSIREILGDMRTPRPMNRLLQGDVGSGKTFVAIAAILLAIDSGCQAALMAPTQILAEQHYLLLCRWLTPLGVRVALRTGSRDERNHLEMEGRSQVLVGTHALIYDTSHVEELGLVIIDEQHRFGVEQRAALIRRGLIPDVLVMTATPIPRTLTMTLYGDLDVSVINEKPAGRGKIVTAVRRSAKQTDITAFVKLQLEEGRQVYLVYPLVDESEKLKIESATAAFEKWRKRLSRYKVALLHGKLAPVEKEGVMAGFRHGAIRLLVCTSVIEVGVDVPNANLMIIYHAERFGLAQLHQLRGRIGRGAHKSYCILLTDEKSTEANEKLGVLENNDDGFQIAEADLRLRGPGDVLGSTQSGVSQLRFPDFLGDIELLQEARARAGAILNEDPKLEGKHIALRTIIGVGSDLNLSRGSA